MTTIHEALEARQFYIAYQPIVDLARRRVFGYEALVRSHTPEFPSPLQIIAAALKERYMGQLGRTLRRMSADGCPSFPLFLNIHPDEFDEGWLVRPDDAVSTHDDIYVEITESVPITHYRHCHSVLREIRDRGARIAVDDLGAGYSNFKYISDLAPEVVKIDRSLVADLTIGTRQHMLVRSLVELCEKQGARVVAEGIETAAELRAVLETGAHYGQGYFFARPAAGLASVDWDRLAL